MVRHKKEVVVVIPIYKEAPSHFEMISFQQCFKVLEKHAIKVLAPKGLNLDNYRVHQHNFEVIYIDAKWLSSIEMYNKLKLSKYFCKLFIGYKYLLTYELDAFVFKDELKFWCEKGYDYIGAPWFNGYENPKANFLGVGNSGFSLRNINAMKHALNKTLIKDQLKFLIVRNNNFLLKLIFKINELLVFFGENYTIQNSKHLNEDAFIFQVIEPKSRNFKIAPVEEAVRFSFELKPQYLYNLNNNTLPMGCHAWWKYDLEFWKPFIESYGYHIKPYDN